MTWIATALADTAQTVHSQCYTLCRSKMALAGKPAGIFTSTAVQGGGQEVTILTSVTQVSRTCGGVLKARCNQGCRRCVSNQRSSSKCEAREPEGQRVRWA